MGYLAISLLGAFTVTLDGQSVNFNYDKVRALLAYLAVEGEQLHRREHIAELLWPDQTKQTARDNLRQALSQLRGFIADREAEPPFLVINRETLQFNLASNCAVDLHLFNQLLTSTERHSHDNLEICWRCIDKLQQAVELYRGEFMSNVMLRDSLEFENWQLFIREQLHQRFLAVLDVLISHAKLQGDYARARVYVWRQLELEPYREEAHRELIYLLALDGQRSAAISQYEHCCRILRTELGAVPMPETTNLYEKIRTSDFVVLKMETKQSPKWHNLPSTSKNFIGRENETTELQRLLASPSSQLVTLIGPGGIGKTQLAIHAAQQMSHFKHGICYVALAPLTSADFMMNAIADALEFVVPNAESLSDQLLIYLHDKELLLVLDNFEHILQAGVAIVAKILQKTPSVKLLVTSQVRLNLPEELCIEVQGLSIGESFSPAVQLFVDCAKRADAKFAFTPALVPAIQKICTLVDGLPMGIELAAVWTRMMTCDEIADAVSHNIEFLSTPLHNIPERHRSMSAIFEYSWSFLSAEEQRVFRCLSVFRGGFNLDAALWVSGSSLSVLLALIDKSMLHRDLWGRYQIHELLRKWGYEKLRQGNEIEAVASRHFEFFFQMVKTAEPKLKTMEQSLWLSHLDRDYDNLRAALDWAAQHSDANMGLQLAAQLWFYWHIRSYSSEGRQWLKQFLALPYNGDLSIQANALWAVSWLAQNARDFAEAEDFAQQSLNLWQRIGDIYHCAYPLSTLAWLDYFKGDYEQANRRGNESLKLFREADDSRGIAHSLGILGYIAETQGDHIQAENLHQEGIAISRFVGDRDSLAWATYLLGRVNYQQGKYEQAERLCQESLQIYEEIHNQWSIAIVFYTLADIELARENYYQAQQLAEKSILMLRELGDWWALGGPLSSLALIFYHQQDRLNAKLCAEESLRYFKRSGDQRGIAHVHNILAQLVEQSP